MCSYQYQEYIADDGSPNIRILVTLGGIHVAAQLMVQQLEYKKPSIPTIVNNLSSQSLIVIGVVPLLAVSLAYHCCFLPHQPAFCLAIADLATSIFTPSRSNLPLKSCVACTFDFPLLNG